ncbi:hypothetical protein [Cryptosporangium sp. NPDC048952]|uniref:hypothetical protein n=1 Tax=Cryptosporangium sp. NPDC048952 TaxID=3363961 RepID=UPI00371CD41F
MSEASPEVVPLNFSPGRSVLAAVGAVLIIAGLEWADTPLGELRVYARETVGCATGRADCLPGESGRVVRRWESIPPRGNPSWGLEVRRADGSRWTKHVPSNVEHVARVGDPARLRIWCGEVVEVAVRDQVSTFLPRAASGVAVALLVSWVGLGAFVAGVLPRRRRSGLLGVKLAVWTLLGPVPVTAVAYLVAYRGPPADTEDYGWGLLWACLLPCAVALLAYRGGKDAQ